MHTVGQRRRHPPLRVHHAEELRLFRLLIAVERIGPKAALGILGRADLATMVRALRSGDAAMVATVPGIGAKTAERVVLELRGKLDGLALPGDRATPVAAAAEQAIRAAVDGLATMGFREAAAREAVKAAVGDGTDPLDVAALVAAALRRLDMVAARDGRAARGDAARGGGGARRRGRAAPAAPRRLRRPGGHP